jgi:hypothetical protein
MSDHTAYNFIISAMKTNPFRPDSVIISAKVSHVIRSYLVNSSDFSYSITVMKYLCIATFCTQLP